MSKTVNGLGASSKTLSGIDANSGPAGPTGPTGPTGPAGPPGSGLAGGAAGQMPYQTAPGVTTFTNATDGVVENLSNVNAFTNTITSIKRLTAPAADNLELFVGGVSKKIKLQTSDNAGSDITFNTNGGVLPDAFTIAGNTGNLTGGNGINFTLFNGAGTANTLFAEGMVSTTGGSHVLSSTTAANAMTVQTNGLN